MKICFSICLILVSSLVFGQKNSVTLNEGGARQGDYFTQIPFESLKGKIVIRVIIDEKAYRFILDTGAPNVISARLYETLKTPTIRKIRTLDQSNKKDSLQVVRLDNINMGGVIFDGIPTLVAQENNLFFECFEVDGFIGSNMLRNSIIAISYPGRTITLTSDPKKLNLRLKESSKIFLTKFQSNPYFRIKLKNKKASFQTVLFDTGMQGFFDVSLTSYSKLVKRNIVKVKGSAVGSNTFGIHGAASDTLHLKLLIPTLVMNGAKFNDLTARTTLGSNSRIGSEILEYTAVTIDYRNKRFYLTPHELDEIDINNKTFPISPTFKNGKLVVGFVWDSHLLPHIGQGDQILSIDGTNCEDMTLCEAITKEYILPEKDSFELVTLDEQGKLHTTRIIRK